MITNDMPQLLMTAGQVAEALAVSSRTVWRLVAAGLLPPPVRYSRKLVRWKRSDVEDHVAGLKGGRQ